MNYVSPPSGKETADTLTCTCARNGGKQLLLRDIGGFYARAAGRRFRNTAIHDEERATI